MKEMEINTQPLQDFSDEAKKDILDIIQDCPTLVSLGNKEYKIKNLRYYSLYRICKLVLNMRKADSTLDNDNKIITALCTDLDAMCEVMAIILCNHYFTPNGEMEMFEEMMSRNEKYVSIMKAKVMGATYMPNQWAAIIVAAIKSIDLTAFFLLKELVSSHTNSLMERKKKSTETASQFTEALSLQTHLTSSEPSHSTP